jgi:HK97 family phage prohead protease
VRTYRQRAQEPQEDKKPDKPKDKPEEEKKPQDKPQEKPQTDKPEQASSQPPKKGSKALTRELSGARIKALEGEGNERKFELSFSSEEPYNRGWCIEILDHAPGAVDLTRLNEIGVLLFNHKRDNVLGKIERAWIDGSRGYAVVEFDSDEAADVVYQKVKSGTLKGVSVGYQIESIEEVMLNGVSADGRFKGPCDVARKWSPYEISIVSVPADPTVGVGRDYEPAQETRKRAPSLHERQLQINHNILL